MNYECLTELPLSVIVPRMQWNRAIETELFLSVSWDGRMWAVEYRNIHENDLDVGLKVWNTDLNEAVKGMLRNLKEAPDVE